MKTRDALLLAVCQQPAEDTPRLVYADCLDDEGEHARAEFIRAQVELAVAPETIVAGSHCPACGWKGQWRRGVHFDHEKICMECKPSTTWEPGETIANPALATLRAREAALRAAHEHSWRCETQDRLAVLATILTFRRGFVDSIEIDHALWTPEFAAEVCRQIPLSRVKLRGRDLLTRAGSEELEGGPSWDWHEAFIRKPMFSLMRKLYPGSKRGRSRRWLEFPSEAAALDALAHTAAEWGRRLAFGTAKAMA